MKSIITVLIVTGILFYSSGPKIKLKPFSVSFESPYIPFAILFLAVSITLFQISAEKRGYKKGVQDLSDSIIEAIKE